MKEIGMIKERYSFGNTFNIQVTFMLVRTPLGFLTGELDPIQWLPFNFFRNW